MKTEKSAYVRVLLWAYSKQEDGFTRRDLRDHFQFEDGMRVWVEKMFFRGTDDDRPLIDNLVNRDGQDYFALTYGVHYATIEPCLH